MQCRSADRQGMVEERRDPTDKGVGVARDAELHEHRHAIEVGAFTDKVRAVELEDRNYRQVYSATGRRKAAERTKVGAVRTRLADDQVAVVAQRAVLEVEVYVRKGGEELPVSGGDGVMSVGDLSGQFRSGSTGFECCERCRNVLSVLRFEMS